MAWLFIGFGAIGYLIGFVTAGILASGKRSDLEAELARQVRENYDLKECILHAKEK